MEPQTILLDPAIYHDYVEGKEVSCASKLSLHTGDHVMVYKNSLAASTSIPVPHSSWQSESIGIEGLVTSVAPHSAGAADVAIKKI
jgi:hypothetical protein